MPRARVGHRRPFPWVAPRTRRRCLCHRRSSSGSRHQSARRSWDDGDRQTESLTEKNPPGKKKINRSEEQLYDGRTCFSRPAAALAVPEEAQGGFWRVRRGCWRLHPGGAPRGPRSSVRPRRRGESRRVTEYRQKASLPYLYIEQNVAAEFDAGIW